MENQADSQIAGPLRDRNEYLREYRVKNKAALKVAAQLRKDKDREGWLKRKRDGTARRKAIADEVAKAAGLVVSRALAKKRAAVRWSRVTLERRVKISHMRHRRRARQHGNSTPEDLASAKLKIVELKAPGDFPCVYCLRIFPSAILTIDHIIPISKGGPHSGANLARACFRCNSKKRDSIREFGCFAI